jgi:hypothetical protein
MIFLLLSLILGRIQGQTINFEHVVHELAGELFLKCIKCKHHLKIMKLVEMSR